MSDPTDNDPGMLQRIARLLGVPPRAVAVAVATAEAREEAPHPLDPDALLARRQALVARRRELAEAGEEAGSALSERLRPIEERKTGLRERASELRRQLAEAEAEALGAEISHFAENSARERAARVLEVELRESADPRVLAFIRELQDELAALRLKGPTSYAGPANPYSDLRRHYSNYESLVGRLDALQGAIAAAESLMLAALTAEEVEARLGALRVGLPEVEVRVAAA